MFFLISALESSTATFPSKTLTIKAFFVYLSLFVSLNNGDIYVSFALIISR